MAVESKDLNSDFKYEVANRPGAENIKACFTCGVCTAGCPLSEVDERYNPRKLVRMILLGLKEELLSSDLIWLCNQCYNCYAHCPQDVKFTDVITVLREMAREEGYAPPESAETIEEIDTLIQAVRRDLITRAITEEDLFGDEEDLRRELRALLAKVVAEEGGDES